MPNVIRIKRRTSGVTGAPSSLKNAELAFNEVDQKLYYGKGDDGGGNATSIITIAGVGWDTMPDLSNYGERVGDNTWDGDNIFSATSTLDIAGTWLVDGVAVLTSAAELNVLDAVTAGTASASKALVVDASKNINLGTGGLTSATVTTSGNGAVGGNLTVTGNLTVNGTTTTINSTVITIDDPIFTVGGDSTPSVDDNKDRGVAFQWHNGTAAKVGFFGYDDSASVFTFVPDVTITSEVIAGTAGDVAFGKVNNVTITTPAAAATLTLGSGKTIAISNTLTFTGTDSSSVAFGAGGTVAYIGSTLAQFAATTSAQLAGVISDETGSGALVFANSPTLVTPVLGTPSSGTLTSCTGLPISTGVSGLGTGVATFLATPSSANLISAVTDETGTGSLVFATSPALVTPALAGETFSTTNNATAGTNVQGQGALTSDYNVITTTAASPSGVTLPTATTGRRIIVVNKGTNSISIFPATGAQVDAAGVNAAITLAVNGVLVFNASSTTQWYSSFNSAVAGTGVTVFSAGTTGLTPNSATTGAITLGGTLAVANGGTGVTTSTGSGNVVLSTSPTLTTPTLGLASATSVNKVAITAPATSATLTIADGKTLTASNTLTFTGTDSSSVAFGAGGTVAYIGTANAFTGANTFTNTSGQVFRPAATQDGIILLGRAGGTSSFGVTLATATLTAARVLTLPDATGTVALIGNTLASFAVTTSAQLAGVISDETGSGKLVFATSPTFTTSVVTDSATLAVFNTTATTVTTYGAATSLTLGYAGTAASTTNIATGATATATTNAINIGTGGTTGSTTTVNIGSAAGGTTIVNNNLTVTGNLIINGTTTTVNSTTMTVDDPIITLGGDTAPVSDDNKDRGVEFRWHNGTSAKVGFFGYDDSTGKLAFIPDATNTSEVFAGTLGTIDVGAVHINGSQIAASNLSNSTTGSGSIVLATSPTLVTPVLGTPSSGTLTSCTGLPISTGVSGLGTGVATFLGTPSSANLAVAVTDETGSGSLVFATSPTLVTPVLGTPSSGTLTSCTGLPISTGVSGLGTGVATFLATPSSANLVAAVTDETGSGSLVFGTSPTITTPTITFSTAAAVTAGTNAQNQGALTSDVNVVTTAVNSPSGVTLPAATVGRRVIVVNKGANGINVYPATGSTINALSANAAIQIPVNGAMTFLAATTTQWYSSANDAFAAPTLGTPVSGTLTNCIGLPISSGVSGLGANVATFLATPSSANLAAALTDETGSSSLVFSTSPQFTTSVTTNSATLAVFNETATTVAAFGAATTLAMGAATGTTTVNNDLALGVGKVVKLPGSTSGTLSIAGPATAGTNTITFPAETGTVVTTASVCTAVANCTFDGGTF